MDKDWNFPVGGLFSVDLGLLGWYVGINRRRYAMTYTTDHLAALMTRLANETARHGDNPNMSYYLESIRREIKGEEEFLAKHGVETYAGEPMTDDEIFAELGL